LPAALQEKVNEAVDYGVIYLKRQQQPDGSWATNDAHRAGLAALPALTLLECGESKFDVAITNAVKFVRSKVRDLEDTYDIALSIMLLDRNGDPKDKAHIQTLACRLISGQTITGGWGYKCPGPTLLKRGLQQDLLAGLQQMNPPRLGLYIHGIDPTVAKGKGAPSPAKKEKADAPTKTETKKPVVLAPQLKLLPVFQEPKTIPNDKSDPEGEPNGLFKGTTDNSNTQFAIVALAVSRRWEVPIERSMALVLRRFETSQDAGGGWNYPYKPGGVGEKNTMNCAGLIGLAVAHAVAAQDAEDLKKRMSDEKVTKGLEALGRHVGEPTGQWQNHPQADRYFLWSLERVGMLYDLPTIGEKDWYRWGAERLVANIQTGGFWPKSDYPGSDVLPDTCMALLFLKKANLVKDLAVNAPAKKNDPPKPVDPLPATPPPAQVITPVTKAPEPAPAPPVVPQTPAPSVPTVTQAAAPSPPVAKEEKSKLWLYLGAGGLALLLLLLTTLALLLRRQKRGSRNDEVEDLDEVADEGLVEVEAIGKPVRPAKNGSPPPLPAGATAVKKSPAKKPRNG
jgi:hypothetical protein